MPNLLSAQWWPGICPHRCRFPAGWPGGAGRPPAGGGNLPRHAWDTPQQTAPQKNTSCVFPGSRGICPFLSPSLVLPGGNWSPGAPRRPLWELQGCRDTREGVQGASWGGFGGAGGAGVWTLLLPAVVGAAGLRPLLHHREVGLGVFGRMAGAPATACGPPALVGALRAAWRYVPLDSRSVD